jgi:hypothetical protein
MMDERIQPAGIHEADTGHVDHDLSVPDEVVEQGLRARDAYAGVADRTKRRADV